MNALSVLAQLIILLLWAVAEVDGSNRVCTSGGVRIKDTLKPFAKINNYVVDHEVVEYVGEKVDYYYLSKCSYSEDGDELVFYGTHGVRSDDRDDGDFGCSARLNGKKCDFCNACSIVGESSGEFDPVEVEHISMSFDCSNVKTGCGALFSDACHDQEGEQSFIHCFGQSTDSRRLLRASSSS